MNYISLCGLLPFAILSIHYSSYGMAIIVINGFLFHSFSNNKILYFIDFTTNSFFFIKASVEYSFIFKYLLFSSFVFLMNNYYLKKYKNLCEIIHVIFVQWVGLYSIISVYEYNGKLFPKYLST